VNIKLNDSSFPRVLAEQLAGKEFKLGDDSLALSTELIEFVASELGLGQYIKAVNGLVPSSALPVNFSTRYTAASQTEMFALGARIGETCIRTDLNPRQVFTVINEPSNVLSSWDNITDQVTAILINGQQGPIFNLAAVDVGADPVGSSATVRALLDTHANSRNNPHQVSLSQLGATALGRSLVEASTATSVLAILGLGTAATANVGDFDLIGAAKAVQDLLTKHVGDSNNPHTVSLAQLGATALGIALVQSANAAAAISLLGLGTAATRNSGDFDPSGSAASVYGQLVTHAQDINNPHQVSLAQLGVSTFGINFTKAATAKAARSIISQGYDYYQASVPTAPLIGESWGELDVNGVLIDEWVFNGLRWIGKQTLAKASAQANFSTYPGAVFFGYFGSSRDILVQRISFNHNQASGFVAGSTYCVARFQLTGVQLDQTGGGANYREIGIVNQISTTACSEKDINQIFTTGLQHYAVGVHVTKVGTGTTSTIFTSFGIHYKWVRK
jgi:hypothetical protein